MGSIWKPGLLVFTSALFLTNAYHAYSKNKRALTFVWILLSASSIIHHGSTYANSPYKDSIRMADKIFGVLMVLTTVTFYSIYQIPKKHAAVVLVLFIATLILYFIGSLTQSMCFSEENGQYWHALMHCIGCVGNHVYMNGLV